MYKPFKPNLRLRMLLLTLTLAIFNLFATEALAQDLKITGKVLGVNSSTIPGASIKVKGKPTGAATDVDGAFTIKAAKGDVLIISYIGYKTKEVSITSATPLNIILDEDTQKIDEVVVVGYGTMKKSDLTGAVASVKKEDITKRATSNAAEALQGRIAGVNIQKTGGNAGAGISVKIRGVNTFGNNEPLYIVDGFPGSINNINPSEIESIEVLKDGAAAAIYGSVAANGVVLITTKKAKEGNITVDFNSYINFKKIEKQLDLLNSDEYKVVAKDMYTNGGENIPKYITQPSDVNTDWQDEAFRNGFAQNYSINVSGGQEKLKFALSANYNKEKGIIIGNEVDSKNVRMKINFKKSIFEVDANINYLVNHDRQPHIDLKELYQLLPMMPVYDKDEQYGYTIPVNKGFPISRNPMAEAHYINDYTNSQRFTGNAALGINLTSWLQFKTSYSFKNYGSQYFYHIPFFKSDDKLQTASNSDQRSLWQEQLWDNTINANKSFGKHSISLLAGSSTTLTESNGNGVTVKATDKDGKVINLINEHFTTVNGFKGGTYSGSGTYARYNRLSVFGRVNYNYDNRYLFQATFRKDASSKFGKDQRWASFPSFALGWRISEESFFPKNSIVKNLKLRASYGRIGNENVLGYYDFSPSIAFGNNLGVGYIQNDKLWTGAFATSLENNNLKWETTETYNLGFDFGLFDNKLSGTINYFNKNTKDLLVERKFPESSGISPQYMNVGKINNDGFEFELNFNNSINKFNYNIGFNVAYLRNEITKLFDDNQVYLGEGLDWDAHVPVQSVVGRSIASYYLYEANGIFQNDKEINSYYTKKDNNGNPILLQPDAKPGDIRFKDVNGDGVINDKDKKYYGSGTPKVEANLSFSGSYANFDCSFLLGSAWGHKLYNGNRYYFEGMNSGSNMLKSTVHAWTPQNTNTDVPRAVFGDPNENNRESTRFLEDGDFIRLRQIQVGYSLPKSIITKVGFSNVRIYISGENLFTWTKYNGIDPEFNRDLFNTGVDKFIYPYTKSYVAGLQFTF